MGAHHAHHIIEERGKEEDKGGDSFTSCPDPWVSTFLSDRREITAFTF